MAALLQQQGGALRGKRVLELGAGTGIGGLSAAACGADVLLSDQAHMLALLNENIAANGLQVQAAQWRTPCALRPAPCAMRPAPCSHAACSPACTVPPCHRATVPACTMHHAPCTMRHASFTLCLTPFTLYLTPAAARRRHLCPYRGRRPPLLRRLGGGAAWSESPPLAAPQLGSCASSGRAWRLWAARHSQGEPAHWVPSHCLGCSS